MGLTSGSGGTRTIKDKRIMGKQLEKKMENAKPLLPNSPRDVLGNALLFHAQEIHSGGNLNASLIAIIAAFKKCVLG